MSRLSDEELRTARGGGVIGLFTRHQTAANLLMVLMIVAGAFSLAQLNRQFFPDFGIDRINITVAWPGASAEDVDGNIIQAIEPEVRFIDGVDEVTSTSFEGVGVVSIAFKSGSDMQKALSEIRSAVAQVSTLPEDSEDVTVRQIVRYDTVVRMVLSGPYSEESLKTVAKRVRDDLLARGIDRVDLTGVREEEIWVEVRPETLRRLDLTLEDAAQAIRSSNRNVPAGTLAGGERQIRSLGLQQSAGRLADVEVKALKDGTKLYLRDIANVIDTFEENGITMSRRGNRAIEMQVDRALGADMLDVASIVRTYLAEVSTTLPSNLKIETYNNRANLVRDRIRVLLENGASGLILVLLILFLFLSARIAFWVAIGIPVSLFATMVVMLASGQSINMLSLFGLIMAIGIVVDDAIVVGEHADARADAGAKPLDAATGGALRMAAPITSSTLTTIAAFMPLFVIGGIIGDIISAIPFVVVAILIASLIECFLVLPTHMHGALKRKKVGTHGFRAWFDRGFKYFRERIFRTIVTFAIRWRYVTVAWAAAAFLLAVGLVAGEHIKFMFFPTPETDTVFVNIEMVAGTSREETTAALNTVERALYRTAEKKVDGKTFVVRQEDEASLFRLPAFLRDDSNFQTREMAARDLVPMSVGVIGRFFTRGPGGNSSGASDTLAGIRIELLTADRREIRTADFIKAWRAEVPDIPNIKTLAFRPQRGGPPGRDLDIRLVGSDIDTLKAASEELRVLLADFPGVSDVEDDLPYGKPETILEVSGRGRSLGFTTQSVAEQVRGALQGTIAQRFARNDEEITVRVQYPRDVVNAGILETLYLRSPSGGQVPLDEITTRRDDIGFSRIKRVDGAREVAITAEIDTDQVTTASLENALTSGETPVVRDVAERYGLRFEFKGRSEEQAETFDDMRQGAILGLIGIYIILAWVFGSYFRPIVVMLTIPLGAIGTFAGHYLSGYDVTILSMIALIGLSGIVINDSIVLITTIDERQKVQGHVEAVVDGACDRLRAVLLTSMTTIGGLTPLIFETSLQAQFLIPMAITIVFGLAVATLLILLVVPSLVAIQGDIGQLMSLIFSQNRKLDVSVLGSS